MLRPSRPLSVSTLLQLGIAIALASILAASAAQAQDEEGGFEAYVNTTALNLRAGPGTDSNIVGILLKYDRIRVLEQTPIGRATWYSIEASGGYTNGWVNARYVEFGEAPAGIFPAGPVDYGEKQTPTLMKGPWQYQGAGACRDCHMKPTGDFHLGASQVWEHHVHSSAYQTLKREYTREIARRTRGIDDPINDWRCVKCHTTAFGADESQIGEGYSNEQGVTCEVCHGPSSEYANVDHGPDVPNREAMGFRILKDLTGRREVCTSCHNPASPTYVPFNLREFSRDIAHWVDKGDSYYYADARAEAGRREAEVERARKARAAKALAEREAAEKAAAEKAAAEKAKAQSKAEREAAEAERKAEADAEKQRLAALSAQQKAEEERKAKAAAAAAAAAEAKRMKEEEHRKAEAEREKAEAALAQEKAQEAERAKKAEAARKKAEAQARAAAAKSSGIEKYLEDVDDVVILNSNGKKYNKVEFAHLAHASNQYMPDGQCQTCHHTQEGDESPEACNTCHEIGGDADEEKAKKRYVHTKTLSFPKPEGQEQVSCVGCHKSQNELLEMGKRTGDKAPTKCTLCHTRKK
jgi:hypothetical protein